MDKTNIWLRHVPVKSIKAAYFLHFMTKNTSHQEDLLARLQKKQQKSSLNIWLDIKIEENKTLYICTFLWIELPL